MTNSQKPAINILLKSHLTWWAITKVIKHVPRKVENKMANVDVTRECLIRENSISNINTVRPTGIETTYERNVGIDVNRWFPFSHILR